MKHMMRGIGIRTGSVVLMIIISSVAVACTAAPSTSKIATPTATTPTSTTATALPPTTNTTLPPTTTTTPPPTSTSTAPSTTTTTPPTTTTPVPTSSPYAISIVEPSTFAGGSNDVTVVVQVSGFDLVDGIGQPNMFGQGHINYSIHADSPGAPQITTPGAYVSSAATSYTWKGLVEAVYTFSAELVNNDGTPLTPPVVTSKQVTVYPG